MTDNFDRGVLATSSWHKLETVDVFTDAASMIAHGENSGAWPVKIEFRNVMSQLEDGSLIFTDYERNSIAHYKNSPPRIVGTVGGTFNPFTKESRDILIHAACAAGARPSGAFSLRHGRTTIGTFEINGRGQGISTQLLIADTFDGKHKLSVGFTSIRVVCANTLARAFMADGRNMAKLGHNSTLEENVKILSEKIGQAIEQGHAVQDLYRKAKEIKLGKDDYKRALDILVPLETAEDASKRAVTRAENEREDLLKASTLDVNRDGEETLASLWNGATWLIDRKFGKRGEPELRQRGDSEPLDSLLFGNRGIKVDTIYSQLVTMVEMIDKHGKIVEMPVHEAAQTTGQKEAFAGLLDASYTGGAPSSL